MDIQKISNAVTGTMIVIKATIPERFACEDIAQMEGFIHPSFGPISAYGAHAASAHYSATPETNSVLKEGRQVLYPRFLQRLLEDCCIKHNLILHGRTVSMGEGQTYAALAASKNGHVIYDCDFIDMLWEDRPSIPCEPVFSLAMQYAGESAASKLTPVHPFSLVERRFLKVPLLPG